MAASELLTGGAVGAGTAFAALLAEAVVHMDPATVVGGGGVGVAGWLAATAWSAYKRWVELTKLQTKVLEASLARHEDEAAHRAKEEAFWRSSSEAQEALLVAFTPTAPIHAGA